MLKVNEALHKVCTDKLIEDFFSEFNLFFNLLIGVYYWNDYKVPLQVLIVDPYTRVN